MRTRQALRGFERFASEPNVIIANTAIEFQKACARVLQSAPAALGPETRTRLDALFWDRCIANSNLKHMLETKFDLLAA